MNSRLELSNHSTDDILYASNWKLDDTWNITDLFPPRSNFTIENWVENVDGAGSVDHYFNVTFIVNYTFDLKQNIFF